MVFTEALAQECSQLLSQGIYDISSSASELSTASSFSSWFCDKHFSSAREADNFGASLGVPFEGIPIKFGFNADSQDWSVWYSSFCSRVQQDQSLQSKVRDYVQTVNPQIIQAYTTCIEQDGLHVWLERTYDPKIFKFAARFKTPNETSLFATIEKFSSGPNVTCDDQPVTIYAPIWRTRCTRENNDPVTMIVRANWDVKGGGELTLEAIYTPSPKSLIKLCEDEKASWGHDHNDDYLRRAIDLANMAIAKDSTDPTAYICMAASYGTFVPPKFSDQKKALDNALQLSLNNKDNLHMGETYKDLCYWSMRRMGSLESRLDRLQTIAKAQEYAKDALGYLPADAIDLINDATHCQDAASKTIVP